MLRNVIRRLDDSASFRWAVAMVAIAVSISPASSLAQTPNLKRDFEDVVRPFLTTNCAGCHGMEDPEAALSLTAFTTLKDVTQGFATWQIILERLEAGEMPPEDARPQPSTEARQTVINWIKQLREFQAEQNAGDPGRVLARRLSSAEYNYTIRDLTGVDIQPAREFPVDPANEAGFVNSGESLTMTPALFAKYLDAARSVAEHLLLTPDGLEFAPRSVVAETDLDTYCVRQIVDFYRTQNTSYADYFFAAWRFRHRKEAGASATTLAEIAAEERLSSKYLERVWSLLSGTNHDVGPVKHLRTMWESLPEPAANVETVRSSCREMQAYVEDIRAKLAYQFPKLQVRGINRGSQPLVLWRNQKYSTHRMQLNRESLSTMTDESGLQPVASEFVRRDDPEKQARQLAALEEFCAVFPDAFYIAERGREFLDRDPEELEREKKGRFLSAGFHSMKGYFRDDRPLYELVLNEDQQRELDTLWWELDFLTRTPLRQHRDFIWFERAESRFLITEEFDFARSEDKDATSDAKIEKLAELYLEKAERLGADETALAAMGDYFRDINTRIRQVEAAQQAAEASHLAALESFAERAYRRPITDRERTSIGDFYKGLRDREGLSHEDSVRDSLVSILMSPHFCYLIPERTEGIGVGPLSGFALASRLSYYLWSSTPDEQLLAHARSGKLLEPVVLRREVRRMMADQRSRGFATEFGGYWLDFRQFETHNSVDRDRFPEFDDSLRQSMFEEPIRFIMHVVQEDRSILEFLNADHTFVNEALARHYGIDDINLQPGEWRRLEHAQQYGRGGLLPMAVFLTKNAPGLRTSPVKRGYWVVRQLLGERIPPPPPDVPELPSDEAKLGDLTMPEVLARHRENKSCAACHARFDSIGVAFEGYGPVGELRSTDLGGRPVDSEVEFPDGTVRDGLAGLRDYVRQQREEDFIDNLCRKLLSYALGRTLIPSDERLIREMREQLVQHDYRFSSMVESIVTSPQFLMQRGTDYQAQE